MTVSSGRRCKARKIDIDLESLDLTPALLHLSCNSGTICGKKSITTIIETGRDAADMLGNGHIPRHKHNIIYFAWRILCRVHWFLYTMGFSEPGRAQAVEDRAVADDDVVLLRGGHVLGDDADTLHTCAGSKRERERERVVV